MLQESIHVKEELNKLFLAKKILFSEVTFKFVTYFVNTYFFFIINSLAHDIFSEIIVLIGIIKILFKNVFIKNIS